MYGDGTAHSNPPARADARGWTLTVPETAHALRDPNAGSGTQRPGSRLSGAERAERASRRILHAVGLAAVLGAVAACAIPITRTVELDGHLVPERVVYVRAAEPGLLTEIHVAAGDTVQPGQLVARLRSPQLDEATRASTGHDPALLARRVRLRVHAPPHAEHQPDGAADPASFWRGGVVLTEDLDERRGARLDTGDTVLDLAALGADGRVPHVVRAWAPEREALRARPGMPARLTFTAIPQERPRQASGVVRRVALAPEAESHAETSGEPHVPRWRVEVDVHPEALASIVGAALTPTELRAGFSVEVAIEERRETLLRTVAQWARARISERANETAVGRWLSACPVPSDLRCRGGLLAI